MSGLWASRKSRKNLVRTSLCSHLPNRWSYSPEFDVGVRVEEVLVGVVLEDHERRPAVVVEVAGEGAPRAGEEDRLEFIRFADRVVQVEGVALEPAGRECGMIRARHTAGFS